MTDSLPRSRRSPGPLAGSGPVEEGALSERNSKSRRSPGDPQRSPGSVAERIRDDLSEAGARLLRAQNDRAEAISDITRLASQAQKAGVSIAEIARLATVTRQTVYSLIRGRV